MLDAALYRPLPDALLSAPPVGIRAVAAAIGGTPAIASRRLRAAGWHRVQVAADNGDRFYAPRGLTVAPIEDRPATHLRCLLWDALAALGPHLSASRRARSLAQTAAVPLAIAEQLLAAWVRQGLAIATAHADPRYRLHPDTDPRIMPPTTSRARTDRDRIWSAIRVLRRFDVPTLMTAADTSRSWTQAYVGRLERAGILRIHTRGVRSAGIPATYQLARDTGRVTPRLPERSAGALADGGEG